MKYVNEKLHEFEEFIRYKKVAIIGIEKSNLPLLDYLCDKKATVIVFDKRNIDEIEKEILDKITARCIKFYFGENCLINLIGYDLIFRNSKYKYYDYAINAERLRGAIVTTEHEMLMELCPR